eukprot:TRINITY_DN16521_c0_g1_i1.p1 TRINITY_DN16521_c0_g1~~TRINITY_DN16521_c0_g1_i1.p1  ORF type:complete len:296 (-),score=35.91 TRINITY_DN16521_c0_g1_i1:28-915(-)
MAAIPLHDLLCFARPNWSEGDLRAVLEKLRCIEILNSSDFLDAVRAELNGEKQGVNQLLQQRNRRRFTWETLKEFLNQANKLQAGGGKLQPQAPPKPRSASRTSFTRKRQVPFVAARPPLARAASQSRVVPRAPQRPKSGQSRRKQQHVPGDSENFLEVDGEPRSSRSDSLGETAKQTPQLRCRPSSAPAGGRSARQFSSHSRLHHPNCAYRAPYGSIYWACPLRNPGPGHYESPELPARPLASLPQEVRCKNGLFDTRTAAPEDFLAHASATFKESFSKFHTPVYRSFDRSERM